MSDALAYSHEMIMRDVVYYLNECAEYYSIAYDLDWTPLLGPYCAYLAGEDPLVRHGTREWLLYANVHSRPARLLSVLLSPNVMVPMKM